MDSDSPILLDRIMLNTVLGKRYLQSSCIFAEQLPCSTIEATEAILLQLESVFDTKTEIINAMYSRSKSRKLHQTYNKPSLLFGWWVKRGSLY